MVYSENINYKIRNGTGFIFPYETSSHTWQKKICYFARPRVTATCV